MSSSVMSWVLPTIIFLPLAGALLLMLVPREEEGVARGIALFTSIVTFLVSLVIFAGFDKNKDGFQLVFDKEWVPGLGAHFKVGIDGISIWLVLLTTFLTPIVLLSAWGAIKKKVKEFLIAFLILETGMIGTFVSLDLFLFYVMWEVMLIPMYFIIGVWGGDRRVYASIKFVIYTMVGSLLMLVAIFYLYVKHGQASGVYTFDLEAMYNLQVTKAAQTWCFLAFALAFAIKVPLFPFHTWLPDAHVEAPTAGSVILAGVLLKFGVYGFIRFAMPIFPHASYQLAPYIVLLAVIGVVYGAVVAFAQDDVKKLVAYSSVSHMGFCILGLFAMNTQGIEGSIYAMLSHGLTTSGLFLGIGVLYERRHTRKLADYGGIWARMPLFSAFFLIITLGSAGLPGLSGFIGEFLALIGAFDAGKAIPYAETYTAVAATGVILGAVYLLYMFQKVFFGPVTNERNQHLPDLSGREIAVFLPIILFIFVMGLYPKPFLGLMEKSVTRFITMYEAKRARPADSVYLLVPLPPPPVAADATPPTPPTPAAGAATPPAAGATPGATAVPSVPSAAGQPQPGQPVPVQIQPGQPQPGGAPPAPPAGVVPPGGSTQPGHEGHNHP